MGIDLLLAAILVIGEPFSSNFRTDWSGFLQKTGAVLELVTARADNWRGVVKARTDIDTVVVPLKAEKLLGELRRELPQALYLVEQPWSGAPSGRSLADYDRLSLECSRFTIPHNLETLPSGFAVETFRGEMAAEEFVEDVIGGDGGLSRRGEYLRAAVWFAKLSGQDIRNLNYRPGGLAALAYELSFLRLCAQQAVNVYTPVPVKNCALEAIGRMTPMPVEQEWWKKRLAEKQKEIAVSGGNFDLVFVGSSQIHIWETRCPVQMKDLERDFTVLNLGYSGDSFQKVYWRLTKGKELDGYRCKCLMMVQGGNNSERPTAMALGMKMLLDAFKVKQPQAKVVLHPINPRREWDPATNCTTPRPRPEADRANEILKQLAEANDQVIWCDFRREYYDENDDTLWCMPGDRLHAGTEGLKIWYSHISPIFHKVCGKPLPPVTVGTLPEARSRVYYKPFRHIWDAELTNRGGFTLEKREGAEGKIEISNGRLMVHKTNDQGYLLLRAHPFAAYTNIPMRVYADVEVVDAEPQRSFAFLRVHGRTEDFSVQAAHRRSDPVESWTATTGLELRPAGVTTRKYCHFNSVDADNYPVLIVCGMPSKTYWTNWRVEETNDPGGRSWRRNPLPADTRGLMPPAGESDSTFVILGSERTLPTVKAQLGLLDISGVPYQLYTPAEAIVHAAKLLRGKTVVFLGVKNLSAELKDLIAQLDKPGKVLVYAGDSGVEGGLPAAAGMQLEFSPMPKSHLAKSASVRWTNLTPGGALQALVESYDFGRDPSRPITEFFAPRATLKAPDSKTQIYATFTDDKSPALALRRDTHGCLHVFVAPAAGLTPDYFNELVRNQGGYAAIDESGVEVKFSQGKWYLRAERSGRFDFVKPSGERETLNLVAGEVVKR